MQEVRLIDANAFLRDNGLARRIRKRKGKFA